MQQGPRPHPPCFDPLHIAGVQYELALRIGGSSAACNDQEHEPAYGADALDPSALRLATAELEQARLIIQMSAVRIVAIAADAVLQRAFPGRFTSASTPPAVVTASLIACVLRNAFAHDLFFPRWQMHDPRHADRFEIPGVIVVDTTAKDGQPVRWEDLGGPLALIGFLRHIASLVAAKMDDDGLAPRKTTETPGRSG